MDIILIIFKLWNGLNNNLNRQNESKKFMKTEFQTLLIEKKSKHILLLTLNRPEFSNAFNTLMANEIIEIFEELSTN